MKRLVAFFCLSLVISVFFAATAYGQYILSVDQIVAHNNDSGDDETFIRFQNNSGAAGNYKVEVDPSLIVYTWVSGGASGFDYNPVVLGNLNSPIVLFSKNEILGKGGTVTVKMTNEATGATFTGVYSLESKYVVTRNDPPDAGGTMNVVAGGDINISAQLSNSDGIPVPISGRTVTWSGSGGGSFSSTTSLTDENGVATVIFTTPKSVGTLNVVKATDDQRLTGSSGVIRTIGLFVFNPSIVNQIAGQPFAVNIQLWDGNGSPVTISAGSRLTLSKGDGRNGVFGGNLSADILAPSTTVTISGVTYSMPDNEVSLYVTGSGGNVDGPTGRSNVFPVDGTLTVIATHGTVKQDPSREDVRIQLTATPDAGYQFANWIGDVVVSENDPTIATVWMDADKTVTANFAPIATYTISGNAGIAGATLSYTDGTAKTATADGGGAYSFTVSYNWSGAVTPSKSGYTFSPASTTYTNVLANQTLQNYTANVIFSPTATPPSGAGTDVDPYQIASLDNLYWIADQTNNHGVSFSETHFLQTANIDASATTGWFPVFHPDGPFAYYRGWDPIGRTPTTDLPNSSSFSGKYDGHGYIISGIFIDRSSPSGLFGEISGASISSLGVTEADIRGRGGVGSNNTGGIAGFASGSSSIQKCFVTGSIIGGWGVGGIVGQTGIAEEVQVEPMSTISNCYSRASVRAGDRYGGGLVGANYNATIENCYSTGSVADGTKAGGLVRTNTCSVTASFWDTETSGQSSSAAGVGKTTAEMKTQSTFTGAGWDFSTIWQMNGANYPELRVFCYTLAITSLNGTVAKNPDQASYNSGTVVTLEATAAMGYTFTGWSGDVSGSTNPANVTMDANKTVIASFAINTYTLSYTAGANGNITGTTPQTVNYGANGSTVTAVPNTGYSFVNWSDGVTTASRTDNNVTGPINVTAIFKINAYTLAYTAGTGGTITGSTSQTVNYDADGTQVTAVPNTGWSFTGWSDGVTTAARTDLKVHANLSVTANFAIDATTTGFVTGGGWIASPAGAYPKSPTLKGKANFAFEAKYEKGISIPKGNLEFQLKPALKFKATSFDALIVSGASAQMTGTGTNDGSGNYGFRLSVFDSKIITDGDKGKGSDKKSDKLRLRIWDKNNGNSLVYDSEPVAIETAPPTLALGGGSITIHKSEGGTISSLSLAEAIGEAESVVYMIPDEYALYNAYPNPFNPSTTIKFDLPEVSMVRLVVYDMLGREVAVLADGERPAGQYSIRFDASRLSSGMYIYRLQTDNFTQTKKLMLMK